VPDGVVTIDDPRADDVRRLLARHLAFAHETTPVENVYALEVEGLLHPAVTFFSYRASGEVLGVGALEQLRHREVKSMHTAEAARGRGIGRAMVDDLVGVARQRGYRALSLESGSGPPFAPARRLYASAGFRPAGASATTNRTSAFVSLSLDADGPAT
jgi:putative acetyltransferase